MRARPPPVVVREYADGCVRAVREALGVSLDFAPETLPLLDHYVSIVRDRPGNPTGDPVRRLVAVTTGVYFGEVVRRAFPARWAIAGPDPPGWRIEFRHCLLTFYPVAVAWEVILHREAPEIPSGFFVDDAERASVRERLEGLPGATIEEYYSFSQRCETLTLTAGWLAERLCRRRRGRGEAPRFTRAAYAALMESIRIR